MSKIICYFWLLFAVHAHAAIEALSFQSSQQEATYHQLTEQLRCPQCQNNSIADSNATIATDMRAKVFELLNEGKSKQEIVDYMVARYGNFVTYDPPLTFSTVILWALPILLLLIGLWLFFKRTPTPSTNTVDPTRLENVLNEKEEQKS
ncbi:cytochrome c-type biogenesis protein CcmH [Pasteurellaceae bacterium HPA106]|uniref:cytochrome c-type biogenesis protein n=1 Tax=Spirabiliibacterium pneumoniae TaxID=221400 RepID=UPI001AAC8478|nr:cytochrome c-type biogenesis protein [Spirabiliibacterium pneumoniae]MBE2897194.1 cytochrome c-type biogenesis protein CcmH [Spirabiliibacterium pneumoniae]